MKHVIQSRDWMTLRHTWRNGVILLLFFCILAQLLTACEATAPPTNSTGTPIKSGDSSIRVEPDLHANAPPLSVDPLLPPGGDVRPAKPGETGRLRAPDGLPLLQPKGIKADDLFREPVKDTDQRLRRLENAVVEIRRDLDAALPAINRLVAIEGDIQELIKQLQTLTGENNADVSTIPPPPPPVPDGILQDLNVNGQSIEPLSVEDLEPLQSAPLTSAGQPPAKPPSQPQTFDGNNPIEPEAHEAQAIEPQAGMAVAPLPPPAPTNIAPVSAPPPVKVPPKVPIKPVLPPMQEVQIKPSKTVLDTDAVRVGDHADKVRIVLETPKPVTPTTDLDTSENILVVDLKGVKATAGTKAIKDSGLIKSMTLAQSGTKDAQAVFELKSGTKILRSTTMPPTPENPNYRVIIDLAPSKGVKTKDATK